MPVRSWAGVAARRVSRTWATEGPRTGSADMTKFTIAQSSTHQREHPITSQGPRGFWRGWHHHVPQESTGWSTQHNSKPQMATKHPKLSNRSCSKDQVHLTENFNMTKSRCRFAAGDNLPLSGLLGNLSRAVGQDGLATAEPKANHGGARTPVSASQPPSNTRATKLAKDRADRLAKSLHRHRHSVVRSEASQRTRGPWYLSHPQHTTFVLLCCIGGFPDNNSSHQSHVVINIPSHLLFTAFHLNYLAPLAFSFLKAKEEKKPQLFNAQLG